MARAALAPGNLRLIADSPVMRNGSPAIYGIHGVESVIGAINAEGWLTMWANQIIEALLHEDAPGEEPFGAFAEAHVGGQAGE